MIHVQGWIVVPPCPRASAVTPKNRIENVYVVRNGNTIQMFASNAHAVQEIMEAYFHQSLFLIIANNFF